MSICILGVLYTASEKNNTHVDCVHYLRLTATSSCKCAIKRSPKIRRDGIRTFCHFDSSLPGHFAPLPCRSYRPLDDSHGRSPLRRFASRTVPVRPLDYSPPYNGQFAPAVIIVKNLAQIQWGGAIFTVCSESSEIRPKIFYIAFQES